MASQTSAPRSAPTKTYTAQDIANAGNQALRLIGSLDSALSQGKQITPKQMNDLVNAVANVTAMLRAFLSTANALDMSPARSAGNGVDQLSQADLSKRARENENLRKANEVRAAWDSFTTELLLKHIGDPRPSFDQVVAETRLAKAIQDLDDLKKQAGR